MSLMHTARALAVAAAAAIGVPGAAQPGTPEQVTVGTWANQVWETASHGDADATLSTLDRFAVDVDDPALADLRGSIDQLRDHVAKRETLRNERIDEANGELDEQLADDANPIALAEALRLCVELYMLSPDKAAFLTSPRIDELVRTASIAAKDAEAREDWLNAYELYVRLNALYEEQQTYKKDVSRQLRRLAMLRLYAPERLWELRSERRVAEGEEPLPEFNPIGEDFRVKLEGVEPKMVLRAMGRAEYSHVDGVTMRQMILAGLDAVRTMVSTPDLAPAFPGLADASKRAEFLAFVDRAEAEVTASDRLRSDSNVRVLREMLEINDLTVQIPENALFHEFGNGAIAATTELGDDYSSIVWPDEMERWRRIAGSFVGIGVKIQQDEMFNIKIVTPLGNTPAQRAGLQADDIITKVDGVSTVGLTLDQAVDMITGERGTQVLLTVEREDAEGEMQELEVPIVRDEIPLRSVLGWKRTGLGEDDWDWFIDDARQIGYMRITSFKDPTYREFRDAVQQMKQEGLSALILDLRYNPGGYLDRAVDVANAFIPGGVIVSTQNGRGITQDRKIARADKASLAGIPVVVLVNEGSASGAEIVAGAIQDYGQRGDVPAIVVGQRSWGKGSVLSVWEPDAGVWAIKLATQYYRLPGGRLIHRQPGNGDWGVAPDLGVEMLPDQIADSLTIREAADVILDDASAATHEAPPEPETLITDGHDLQLETALVLLQARTATRGAAATAAIKD